ncbi:MAG: hypothetical protein AAGF53_09995 [Pseudomonadota bacterium]
MLYLEVRAGPWPSNRDLPWWIKLLAWLLPAGSPDLEPYYEHVVSWWIEVDETGEPLREIGFSETGEAIVLAPVSGNFGMMLDASDDWSDCAEDSREAAEDFEAKWQALWPKFEKLNQRNKT